MSTVTITEEPLALENLLAIVDGARVELAEGVRAAITASRAVVDHALASNDAVYGLTTQVGSGKDIRLSEEEIRGEQTFLVMSHSGGVGTTAHPTGARCPCGSLERDRPWPLRRVAGGRRGVGGHVERRRPSDRA